MTFLSCLFVASKFLVGTFAEAGPGHLPSGGPGKDLDGIVGPPTGSSSVCRRPKCSHTWDISSHEGHQLWFHQVLSTALWTSCAKGTGRKERTMTQASTGAPEQEEGVPSSSKSVQGHTNEGKDKERCSL